MPSFTSYSRHRHNKPVTATRTRSVCQSTLTSPKSLLSLWKEKNILPTRSLYRIMNLAIIFQLLLFSYLFCKAYYHKLCRILSIESDKRGLKVMLLLWSFPFWYSGKTQIIFHYQFLTSYFRPLKLLPIGVIISWFILGFKACRKAFYLGVCWSCLVGAFDFVV